MNSSGAGEVGSVFLGFDRPISGFLSQFIHGHPRLRRTLSWGVPPPPSATMEENRALIKELPRGTTDSPVVEEIVKLERRLFPKHESLSSSFYQELGKKNGGLLYCVLLDEGKPKEQVVGYVMYFLPSSLYASITKLAVRENYRRKGYGEALLEAAIEKCRSRRIQRICLHVDPLRRPALCLYQKLGFQVDSIVESYYSADRDAYRMYLDFDVQK